MTPESAKQKLHGLNVSRETMDRLKIYHRLLKQWNRKINLVSKSTIGEAWSRHILDSAQIWPHIPSSAQSLTDIGSGAGFPGLVLAIMAAGDKPELSVTLIESDQRKSAFLRSVARETGIRATILSERIEESAPVRADVLTARALADLSKLLAFSTELLSPNGICLFLKGASYASELASASESYSFEAVNHESMTDPNAVLLCLEKVKKR